MALVGLTVVMVVFALLRTEESAWWNVMAWTLRNGATLAPVLAAFFWPLATRSAALTAMLAGFGAGMGWYAASGFHATDFFLGMHPVWVGMTANLLGMVLVTLAQSGWQLVAPGRARQRGVTAVVVAVLLVMAGAALWPWLVQFGLVGLVMLAAMITVFVAVVLLTEGGGASRAAGGGPDLADEAVPSRSEPAT